MELDRRFRSGIRKVVLLVGLVLASGVACPKGIRPSAPTENLEGTLPAGCGVVASVDRNALGPLGDAVSGLVSSSGASAGALAGIDVARDVRFVKYCKFAGVADAGAKESFVVLMSGAIPADALDKAGRAQGASVTRELVDGVAVLRSERGWIARRGRNTARGELVLASDRDLLHATLFNAPVAYATDPTAPLSIVMAPTEIQRLLSSKAGTGPSPLAAAVRELRVNLASGASALTVHFVIGNPAVAAQFADALKPALSVLIRQMSGSSTPPAIADTVAGGDVSARIEVPPAALQALAARISAARDRPH